MQLQHEQLAPSAWVCRFARLIVAEGAVLDLGLRPWAARALPGRSGLPRRGAGPRQRSPGHARRCGRDLDPLRRPGMLTLALRPPAGLTASSPPTTCNRPLAAALLDALRPGGVFIYETFAVGNEQFGRPSNPEFLLCPHELLHWVEGRLNVLAFEQGLVGRPGPAVLQRICAVNPQGGGLQAGFAGLGNFCAGGETNALKSVTFMIGRFIC